MSDRFFVEDGIGNKQRVVLAGAEASHLSRVMRVSVGHEVVLFDGWGSDYQAQVESVSRSEVCLSIVRELGNDREIQGRLVVGVALPKGERQKWLVEKLVEIGVTELVPLESERSVARVDDKVRQRLMRYVVEASKQCGRNTLMGIREPGGLIEFLASVDKNAIRWFAHLEGDPSHLTTAESTDEAVIAVGPEGGWTEEEVAAARQADWQIIGFGSRTLRVETAALIAATLVPVRRGQSF